LTGGIFVWELPAISKIDFPLSGIEDPAKLNLEVRVRSLQIAGFLGISAELPAINTDEIYVCDTIDSKAEETLLEGGKVYSWQLERLKKEKISTVFKAGILGYILVPDEPPHTLGILCDPEHPISGISD